MEKDNRSRDKQKRRKDTTEEVRSVMNDVKVICGGCVQIISSHKGIKGNTVEL